MPAIPQQSGESEIDRPRPQKEARHGRPLPLWMIFPLLFVGVYLSHLTLLRLPYFWDEAGYYIPAAYDFFRTGALVPFSTLSNAHPPLPSIYLALWWKSSGYMPAVTRTAMCLVSSLGLLAVYRLGTVLTRRPLVAAATTLLTALYPVWFAQSTLAHADMFAAAGTLWGLVLVLEALHGAAGRGGEETARAAAVRRSGAAVLCFSLAALAKETAVVTPLALAAWAVVCVLRGRGERVPLLRLAGQMLLPLLPLAAWYAYHWRRTGYVLGNPEYVRYNATATLNPARVLLALGHRMLHVTAHMNMFVPVLCMLAALLLVPLKERDGSERQPIAPRDQSLLYAVMAANLLFFSVIGGALLTRYLLPLYPLVLVLCVSTYRRRVRYWWGLVGLSAAAFVTGLLVPPPYRAAAEDNLAYAAVVRLHQQAIRTVQRFPGSTVLTAWPGSDELTKPELGYVRQPVPVVVVENFSLGEMQRAAQLSVPFTVAFVFSTKDDPAQAPWNLGAGNERLDARYFDFHRDLQPGAIARLLGGNVVWRGEHGAQWAAVLHLDRPQLASLR